MHIFLPIWLSSRVLSLREWHRHPTSQAINPRVIFNLSFSSFSHVQFSQIALRSGPCLFTAPSHPSYRCLSHPLSWSNHIFFSAQPLDILSTSQPNFYFFNPKSDFVTCLNPLITFHYFRNWTKFLAWPSGSSTVSSCLLSSILTLYHAPSSSWGFPTLKKVMLPLAMGFLLTLFPLSH